MANLTESLIHDFSKLLQHSDEYNLIIEAGEEAELKKFQAHSNILRARSPYFQRVLSNDWAKKKDHMLVFKKPNITAKIFEIILGYMYTGVVNLNTEKGADVLQILIAADELELLELINHVQEHLITNESKWLQESAVKTIQIVSRHEPFGKLKEHYFQMVGNNPQFIFKSNDFLSLEESVLVSLLQKDDLNMEEIEVWQSLIKWGIGNTPRLIEQELVSWDAEKFAALQKTIRKCIPLIRYYDISGDDYFNYVIPYKKIIPKSVRKEIWAHHLKSIRQLPLDILPPRVRFTESQIINSQHINIISSWIEKKTATNNYKSPYNFKLIYRGSINSFTVKSFRDLCANQVNTVVVAKITGFGNIVGGYNPTSWGDQPARPNVGFSSFGSNVHEQYLSAPDAFIFNLGDGKYSTPAKVARNTGTKHIAYGQNHGPYFYNDLFFGNNCNTQKSCWYNSEYFQPKILDAETRAMFQVDELEVFQVIGKFIFCDESS
ncbi:hypothetical protein G9A89_017567 [Geosiphon pyriformis]|nr:hypothetical protein G9A89_017567 [Geosiphon pyriformis]